MPRRCVVAEIEECASEASYDRHRSCLVGTNDTNRASRVALELPFALRGCHERRLGAMRGDGSQTLGETAEGDCVSAIQ